MIYAFLAVSAIVPSLLLIWYFRGRDVHREPAGVIWRVFWLGVLSVIPVLLIAVPLGWVVKAVGASPLAAGFLDAFFEAAIPEELCKLLVVWLYASRHREFDEPMDGIVYGAVASLGFATLENVLYTMSGGMGVAVARALTAVPCHASWGAIMGYYVGQARFGSGKRTRHWLLAFLIPTVLHGLYDFPLLALAHMTGEGELAAGQEGLALALVGGALVMLVVSWVWTRKLTRRLRQQQLADQASGEAPLAPRPVGPAAPDSRSSIFAWILLLLGGALASGGGLILLGLALASLNGKVDPGDASEILMGGAILGVVPLALGLLMFRAGIKRRQPAGQGGGQGAA